MDYGYKFETAFKKVFGTPTVKGIYYASFYDHGRHRPILYTACIYSKYYIPEKFNQEQLNFLDLYMDLYNSNNIDNKVDKDLIDIFNSINP